MHLCSRRQQSVDQRQGVGNPEQCPCFGDRLVHGQNALAEPDPHSRKPEVERLRLLRIAPPFQLDATANFSEHQNACPDLLDSSAPNPANDVRMRTFAFANLGDDVGVEQKFHRSTSRQSRWRGWSNTPIKASSARSEPKMSKAVFASGCNRA